MAGRQTAFDDGPLSSYPTFNSSQSQFQEPKASYDDLIDEYASPYGTTAHHQTFHVSTSPNGTTQHRRGPSLPRHKPPLPKQSEETSEASHYYPPPVVKEVDKRSIWQRILPESLACRLFVITVLLETIIDLAIEAELLVRINSVNDASTTGNGDSRAEKKMPVYLSIFAMAHIFQLGMAIDAVYARNTLQFLFLIIFNAFFLLYAIIQINEVRTAVSQATDGISNIPVDILTTIIPIVISIAEIAYIALGWKIYNEFGWQVFKFLGANRVIKKMYASYQVYECLIKFDVFFWVGFSVQFIWLVLQKDDWEYYITCAALPLSVVLLIEGHLAARHENKWMMAGFMSGCVGALVYFVYKLVKVLRYKNTGEFELVWSTLTVFSVIAIILLLATFTASVVVMQNFGRGLKDALAKQPSYSLKPKSDHNRAASTHLHRMSIN